MAGNVFDPSSMAREFQVGERKLTLLPLKIKAFRKVLDMMEDLSEKARALPEGSKVKALAQIILEKHEEAMRIFFPSDDLNHDWIEENLTLTQSKAILAAAVEMNGLDQWFPDLLSILGAPATATR